MKYMECFSKLINIALKNERMEQAPFRAYKFKFTKHKKGYLTVVELQQVEKKNLK